MKKITNLESKESFNEMRKGIEYLSNLESLNKELFEELQTIEEDGFYCILSDEVFNTIPFEERWYTKYELTYHISVLLLKYFNEGHDEIEEQLCKTMNACLSKKYLGHGYDQVNSQLTSLILLYQNGLENFLKKHPEFKNDFDEMVEGYRIRYKKNKFQEGFGSIQKAMEMLFKAVDTELMFTYGTLMRGKRNHHFMKNCVYVGEATLDGYGLLEIGTYPGAIPLKGKTVHGEIYKVDEESKIKIDLLEGSQYVCKESFVSKDGKTYCVKFYEFIEALTSYPLSYVEGKWQQITNEEHIWYAGYGSNLCHERFMAYIQRTTSKQNPLATKRMLFSHPIYFAKQSSRWGKAGVAFLDTDSLGSSYGIMYLITREQFEEIHKMEGQLWYNKTHFISKDEMGIDIVTLTHDSRLEDVQPSKEYLEIIGNGIKNVFQLDVSKINQYLHTPYLDMDYSTENVDKILKDK